MLLCSLIWTSVSQAIDSMMHGASCLTGAVRAPAAVCVKPVATYTCRQRAAAQPIFQEDGCAAEPQRHWWDCAREWRIWYLAVLAALVSIAGDGLIFWSEPIAAA